MYIEWNKIKITVLFYPVWLIFWTFWCMTQYTRYISKTINQVVVLFIYLLGYQDCNIVFAYIYHHYMLTQYSLNICYFWALRWNLSRFTLKFVCASCCAILQHLLFILLVYTIHIMERGNALRATSNFVDSLSFSISRSCYWCFVFFFFIIIFKYIIPILQLFFVLDIVLCK